MLGPFLYSSLYWWITYFSTILGTEQCGYKCCVHTYNDNKRYNSMISLQELLLKMLRLKVSYQITYCIVGLRVWIPIPLSQNWRHKILNAFLYLTAQQCQMLCWFDSNRKRVLKVTINYVRLQISSYSISFLVVKINCWQVLYFTLLAEVE